MKSLLRVFLDSQLRLSKKFDALFLPRHLSRVGYGVFRKKIVPRYLAPGLRVYDLGGGRRPYITLKDKAALPGLILTGVDIDQSELDNAPSGLYDRKICADLCTWRGSGDADIVISLATLEHVPDNANAMRAIASALRPGGRALIYQPSRNALFARLNLLLPEKVKRKLLYTVFPKNQAHKGFRAHYDCCTPKEFSILAESSALVIVEKHLFYTSYYFSFFLPLHILWRIWILCFYALNREQAAESFALVLQKPV